MKLWLLSQKVHNGYDTFDAAIVAAVTEEEARQIHPGGKWDSEQQYPACEWADTPEQVIVQLIGEAKEGTEPGVILASYNAD